MSRFHYDKSRHSGRTRSCSRRTAATPTVASSTDRTARHSIVMRARLRGANVNEHVLQADLVAGDLVHVSLLVDEEKKNVVRLLWMMRSNTGGTTKKAKHSW